MSYRQLTQEQRYQIGASLRIGMSRSEIAKEIKVDKSTVSREIARNGSGRWRYNPSRAIALARERHRKKKKHRIDEATWVRVESLLRCEWSPEQVSKRLKVEGLPTFSGFYCAVACPVRSTRLTKRTNEIIVTRKFRFLRFIE